MPCEGRGREAGAVRGAALPALGRFMGIPTAFAVAVAFPLRLNFVNLNEMLELYTLFKKHLWGDSQHCRFPK